MISVVVLAVVFAALSVAAGRCIDFWGQDGLQAGLFFIRLIAIFAGASLIWRWTGRSGDVAAFVVAGAMGQMAGQIGFWMRDEAKRKKDKGI